MSASDAGVPDTIVARSTPPGPGAVALLRLSGRGAFAILRGLAPELVHPPAPRTATLLRLVAPGGDALLDRALVTVFPGPASYTGEDVVEISCHGGSLVPGRVEEACRALGARAAEPGEFTRRAYLNGKLDLLQAEAVADLVEGRAPAVVEVALHQLESGLSRRVAEMRSALVHLQALLVQHLDFPEEDEAPVPVGSIAAQADGVAGRLEALLSTAPGGTLLKEGALVALAGRPNAGKSSLFNALLGEERAIVTEEPGTTRDALEVPVSLGGYPFRLVDTAGLRAGGGRVERLGIEVALRYLGQARVILFCVEGERALGSDEREFLDAHPEDRVILVRTKMDVEDERGGSVGSGSGEPGVIRVSVRSGRGLAELGEALRTRVYRDVAEARSVQGPVVTRERQAAALGMAVREVKAFAEGLLRGLPVEVAASHLGTAETALEELVGVIPADEVLDVLFREFCIGK
jgi:tRNA modification GTPase